MPLGRPGAPMVIGYAIYIFAGLLAVRAIRRREGPRWWREPPARPAQWTWAALALLVTAFEAAGFQVAVAGAWELSPDLAEGILGLMSVSDEPYSPLWDGLEIALGVALAPVVEELLFRKLLLERWVRRMGTTRAILAQAAVFAVLHLLFVGAFVFGLFAALLYLRTRSIWVPVAFHVLNNAAGGLVWALVAPGAWDGSVPVIRETVGISIAVTAVTAVALAWLAWRLWPREPRRLDESGRS